MMVSCSLIHFSCYRELLNFVVFAIEGANIEIICSEDLRIVLCFSFIQIYKFLMCFSIQVSILQEPILERESLFLSLAPFFKVKVDVGTLEKRI